MTNKEINKIALKLNKKNYLSSLIINMIFFLFLGIMTVSVVFSNHLLTSETINSNNTMLTNSIRISVFLLLMFLTCIVSSSVYLGQTAIFSGRVSKKKSSVKRIIYWLNPSKSLKAFGLSITVLLLKVLWSLAFLLPGSVILLSIVYLAFTGGIEIYLFLSLTFSGAVLILAGIMFSFIITQRYFLTKFLLAENPKLKITQVIKQSKNLMEYQLMTVVKFKLSCILPLTLSITIFPLIFLYPHYKQSLCILAKKLTV